MSAVPIIILEDDASHVKAICWAFEDVGSAVEIRVARSLQEYCGMVALRPPDIALLDLNLPDADSMDVMAVLSKNNPFPVLVMTSFGDEAVAVAAMKAGAIDYLVKSPEAFAEMPRTVHRVLREWNVFEFRKRVEEENEVQRTSDARRLAISESAHDAIFWLDAHGEISNWNPAAQLLFGFSKEEVLGKKPSHFLMPECFREASLNAGNPLHRIGEEFGMGQQIELSTNKKGGQAITVIVSLWTIGSGSQCSTMAIVRDVSEIRGLETKILSISDREQQRIGQDLHDGLGQQLTALEMKCFLLLDDLTASDFADNQEKLKNEVRQISQSLRDCATSTQAISYCLAPVHMGEDGLLNALEQLAQRFHTPGKLECQFVSTSLPEVHLDISTASHLYRIAQEAVTNAAKHAKSPRIEITVRADQHVLQIQIKDYGQGLPDVTSSQGLGMQGMRHRAAAIGALLEMDSARGEGTTCKISLKKQ